MLSEEHGVESIPESLTPENLMRLNDASITPLERLRLQKDIIWGLYQEFRSQARHLETLRSSVNNMIIVVAVAIFGLATLDKELNLNDKPAAWLLILTGVLGFFFSLAYTQRVVKFKKFAHEARCELDRTVFHLPFGRTIEEIFKQGKINTQGQFKKYKLLGVLSEGISSHYYWLILPSIIILAGILVLILSQNVPSAVSNSTQGN